MISLASFSETEEIAGPLPFHMSGAAGGVIRVNRFDRPYHPGRRSIDDDEVAHLLASGSTQAQVAAAVRHSASTVARAAARVRARDTSPYATPAHGGPRRDILGDRGRELLMALNQRYPQRPQQWLADYITVTLQKPVGVGVVQRALKRLQLTSQRFFVLYAEGLGPAAVQGQAAHVRLLRAAAQLDPTFFDGLVYVDFTAVNEDSMHSTRGRAPRGQGGVVVQPSGRNFSRQLPSVDLVFGVNRVLGGVAPHAFASHANGALVVAYFHTQLLPAIAQAVAPGGPLAGVEPTVVVDGASYWASDDMITVLRPLFRAFRVNLVYLPPYAPVSRAKAHPPPPCEAASECMPTARCSGSTPSSTSTRG